MSDQPKALIYAAELESWPGQAMPEMGAEFRRLHELVEKMPALCRQIGERQPSYALQAVAEECAKAIENELVQHR